MNSKKFLMGAAVSAALLLAAPMASACALTAWSTANGTPIAGQPNDATPVARYSGVCGMQADAIGDFVVDETPAGEQSFNAQFYYYTGDRAGNADVYQARSASGGTNLPIRVQHDGTNLIFSTNGSATTRTVAVTDNRWYAISLQWLAGAGTGSLTISVIGAGSDTPLNTPAITGVSNGSDTIEEARLGLVAGTNTSGVATFDAYDSRRTTVPARLCRCDSNNSGSISVADAVQALNEFINGTLATGQPDCNEGGTVTVADGVGALNIFINNGGVCP